MDYVNSLLHGVFSMKGNESLRVASKSGILGTKLIRIIEELLHCAAALESVLKLERNAFKLRDIGAINSLIDEKQRLISLIEAQENNRKELLLTHGYSTDRQGMVACILNLDTRGQIDAMWQQLLRVFQHCQYLNSLNGKLLNLSHRVVESVLQLLQCEEPENRLYNPIGREIMHKYSRFITKL
jgi:flagellar biosynthesis/type III secretory pathway chaperone